MLITDTLYIIYCTYEYERIALGFEDLKTVYKLLPVFSKALRQLKDLSRIYLFKNPFIFLSAVFFEDPP